MRSRQDTAEIFSTYISFESDRFTRWLADPKLRKNMERCLTQVSEFEASKQYFSLYWHQHWEKQSHRLALMHLGAYLQESGYWAANKFSSRFAIQQFSLADCFQVAFTKLDKCLASYQSERGATLESFAKLFFSSTIANELRRAKAIDVVSDWLLLRKLTRKQLIESLKEAGGLDEQAQATYRLAWACFREHYGSQREAGVKRLPKPTMETWSAVAKLYNAERLSQLSVLGESVDASTVQAWLADCVQWARRYLYPTVASLNVSVPGQVSGEAQDFLSDGFEDSLIDKALLVAAENSRLQQQQTVNTILEKAVSALKAPEKQFLYQYYCEGLSQGEIAHRAGIDQSTASRRIRNARRKLMDSLIAWRQEILLAEKRAADMSKAEKTAVSNALKLWLQENFCSG